MPKFATVQNSNCFKRLLSDVVEYFQRCFGFNDVNKRYERDCDEFNKQTAAQPPKRARGGAYESAAKMQR